MPKSFILLLGGVVLAAAATVLIGAWAAQVIGPGAAQGMLLGTTALAAALLYLRHRR